MFAAIGRGVTRRPWLVIASWVVLAVAIIATAPKLADVTNSDQSAFLPGSAESARAAALVSSAFPESKGVTAVIVVRRADGAALTATDIGTVSGLVDRLNAARPTGVRGVVFDPARTVAPNHRIALLATQFT